MHTTLTHSRHNIATPAYAGAALLSVFALFFASQGWLPNPFTNAPLDIVEVLAFVSGLWTVWLAAKNNAWSWPIGIVNSVFFVYLFWTKAVYYDAGLNVFFAVTGVYGLFYWLFGRRLGWRRTEAPIRFATGRELKWATVAIVVLTVLGTQLGPLIRDSAPFIDALTTAISIVAQYFIMKRVFENWIFWIVADLIYIPFYFSLGLHLTSLLYVVFLCMCLYGIIHWGNEMGTEANAPMTEQTHP